MASRILVTGGCGFIGSAFINSLFELPDFDEKYKEVVNIDALYYCSSENNVSEKIRNSKSYKFIKGNINNSDIINLILKEHEINIIVHFAAQSHVDLSFSVPLQYTYDNVKGTHTLLECVRAYGKIEKFIHVSTDEVYGESALDIDCEIHKTEQSILCPTNPYAATKAAAELIAQSYIHSFKLPIIITRSNNVYGENQYPEKLIPRFIKFLKDDKKVTVHGNGKTMRAFIYVKDVVNAFHIILEKGKIGEIYNIGCDENMEYTVLEIAKMLILKIKKDASECNFYDWIEYVEDRPFNDRRYYISNSKLKLLGWKITTSLNDWLEKTL